MSNRWGGGGGGTKVAGIARIVTPSSSPYQASNGDLIFITPSNNGLTITPPVNGTPGLTQFTVIAEQLGPAGPGGGPCLWGINTSSPVTVNGLTPSAFNGLVGLGSEDIGAPFAFTFTLTGTNTWFVTGNTGNDAGAAIFANGGFSLNGPGLITSESDVSTSFYIQQTTDLVIKQASGNCIVCLNTVEVGNWLTVINTGTGTITFAAPNTGYQVNVHGATGGTYTISIAGFTPYVAAFGASAGTLQTNLSDGTHGPVGTLVATFSSRNYMIYVPTAAALTVDFTNLTPTGSYSSTAAAGGQPTGLTVLPGKTACMLRALSGANWNVIGTTVSLASNTANTVSVTTPTPSTGVAFIPNANQDCELSFDIHTSAAFSVTYGPSTGAENTILSSTTLAVGTFFSKRIPAGWSVIITGTIADLQNILAATC